MILEKDTEMPPTSDRPGLAWVLTIEFGNERTAASVLTPDRGCRSVRLSADHDSMPSGVFCGPHGMITGEPAAIAGRSEPAMYVAEPRRWIGAERARLGGGSSVPVVQLVATVLRHVAWTAAAEQRTGPPLEVVLARPGDWNPYQIEQLDRAARMAGVGPVRHIVEPPAGPSPVGSGAPAGSDRKGGAGPGRRPRRRLLWAAAAAGCVAALVAGLAWVVAGPAADPGSESPPVPVSAPAPTTTLDPGPAPTSASAPGTAGPSGGAVPAELTATFPDLGDTERSGSSAALRCSPMDPDIFGSDAGVAEPTYATTCHVRTAPSALLVFRRYPDLKSGPRDVQASVRRNPAIVADRRWTLNGVDQGPVAGVRSTATPELPVVLQFGFDRIPVTVTILAPDLETAQAAFTGIRLTP